MRLVIGADVQGSPFLHISLFDAWNGQLGLWLNFDNGNDLVDIALIQTNASLTLSFLSLSSVFVSFLTRGTLGFGSSGSGLGCPTFGSPRISGTN